MSGLSEYGDFTRHRFEQALEDMHIVLQGVDPSGSINQEARTLLGLEMDLSIHSISLLRNSTGSGQGERGGVLSHLEHLSVMPKGRIAVSLLGGSVRTVRWTEEKTTGGCL